MNPPKEYSLYARSRIVSFFSGLFYCFMAMLFFGWLLDWESTVPDLYFDIAFIGLAVICFFLTQLSSRNRIQIAVYADHLAIRQWRQLLVFRKPEKLVAFDRISAYKSTGSSFIQKLKDQSRYDLCGKRLLLGRHSALIEFASYFTARYAEYLSGANLLPQPPGQLPGVPVAQRPVTYDAGNFDEEVVTRRSAVFYFSIIFGFIFLGAMGAGVILISFDEKSVFMALSGVGIFWFTYYLISRYYRNAPVVKVSRAGIIFNKRFYVWDDVNTVELTGSQPFNILGGYYMEGAKIELSDGAVRYLLDGMYSNLWSVRSFIQNNFPDKVTAAPQKSDSPVQVSAQGETPALAAMSAYTVPAGDIVQYVKGNPYTNFSAILMWLALAAYIGVSAYFAGDGIAFISTLLVLSIPMAGIYLLFTLRINHFGVSAKYLVARNVYHPWKKKVYQLTDIREIVLASNHVGDNTLRLILQDFRTKEYLAAGLRNADWIELTNLLRAYGVQVKDENDFVAWSTPEMKKVSRRTIWYLILYFVVSIASYMGVTQMNVSDTVMIILKICWLLFSILALIGMMLLIVRQGAKKEKENAEKL